MPELATSSYASLYAVKRDDPRIRGLLARDPRLDTVATGLLAACAVALVAFGAGVIAVLV